jgi:class 3 adenylate cyclase/tetratricopeptide (TPR) repeat protein
VSEQRKVVTILFADVVGSTELAAHRDPEVVRSQMSRYFERISDVAAAHGGTVEKFAGDAAMVVFGMPAVHDDDAERAVRAALEIRDRAGDLEVRIGVNTGEAVTAARDDRQFMVSGDAVNIAARLQQGAEPGEVVVGPLTEQLTRGVIDYEPREAIAAKGKAEPLSAFRALRPRTEVPEQARGVPGMHAALVGRRRELRLLLDTFARTAEDRRPHLFTLVGAAGVGKSRLVTEGLAALSGSGARLLRGRCLPYGRGITYFPFIEMVRQDTGITIADDREAALAKLDRWVGELLADDAQSPAVRARIAVMLGLVASTEGMPDTPADRVDKEIAWGMRRYLEAVARGAPLIVVVDDTQWAEPPVIGLLEQLAERSVDAPLLLVCVARPEFLEAHPGWGAGKPNASTITLDPLNPAETGTLISSLLDIEALPARLRAQIIERSAGTPLFCEEFIRMLIDEGQLVRDGTRWRAVTSGGTIRVPESVQAVLAARLDGLPESERTLLQAASVVGERFGVAQVRELLSGSDPEVGLESLRRKSLVSGGDAPGEEMRFSHLLVRDAAYASLPKSQRAALHDRFGSVLETEAADPHQVTEILAHHAERALTLSIELAVEGDPLVDRARRALGWSLSMGERAMARRDRATLEAALHTVRSAATILPDAGGLASRSRAALLEAELLLVGADYRRALRAAADAADLAQQAGLPQLVATARLAEAWISNWSFEGELEDFQQIVDRAVEACRQAGDISGEIEARHVGAYYLWGTGQLAEYIDVNQQLLEQARSIGDVAHAGAILVRLAPAEEMRGNVAAADKHLTEAEKLAATFGLRQVALGTLMQRAGWFTTIGDLANGERAHRQFLAAAEEAGAVQHLVSALRHLAQDLTYLHRDAEAAQFLDRALELSEASGERWNRSELYAMRARSALELGDLDGADTWIGGALDSLREYDVTAVAEVYSALGLIRAAQGRSDEAEAALRRGADVLLTTEYLWNRVDPALDLGGFLAAHGQAVEASVLVETYERWAHERDIHLWDRDIARIRALIGRAGPKS